VHDGGDPVHRLLDPLAGRQVAGQVPDAVLVRPAVPGEDPDVKTGFLQARDEAAAEGPGATGDQDGQRHDSLPLSHAAGCIVHGDDVPRPPHVTARLALGVGPGQVQGGAGPGGEAFGFVLGLSADGGGELGEGLDGDLEAAALEVWRQVPSMRPRASRTGESQPCGR
jgi:hypothetical protein